MPAQEVEDMMARTPTDQPGHSRRPCRGLNATLRFGPAPGQNEMHDAARLEPPSHLLRLRRGFRAQAVIDRKRRDAALAPARPGIGQQAKGETVRTAGNGEGQMGGRLERSRRRHQANEFGLAYRFAGGQRAVRRDDVGRLHGINQNAQREVA